MTIAQRFEWRTPGTGDASALGNQVVLVPPIIPGVAEVYAVALEFDRCELYRLVELGGNALDGVAATQIVAGWFDAAGSLESCARALLNDPAIVGVPLSCSGNADVRLDGLSPVSWAGTAGATWGLPSPANQYVTRYRLAVAFTKPAADPAVYFHCTVATGGGA